MQASSLAQTLEKAPVLNTAFYQAQDDEIDMFHQGKIIIN